MEEVARNDDDVRSFGNYAIDGGSEGQSNVGFPLIYA
jgi:hypothetical protein